jgi:hypothetical protein
MTIRLLFPTLLGRGPLDLLPRRIPCIVARRRRRRPVWALFAILNQDQSQPIPWRKAFIEGHIVRAKSDETLLW